MAVDASWVRARGGALETYPEFSTISAPTTGAGPSRLSGHRLLGFLPAAAFILAAAAFNDYALQQFWSGDVAIAEENGVLENAQLLVTLPSIALLVFAGIRGLGAVRVAGILLALIVSIAWVREIDFTIFTGVHATLDWLVDQALRDWVMALLGGTAAVYFAANLRYFGGLVRLGLRWQAWPCVASLALLALAEFYFDDLTGVGAHFWEELVETNGYFVFALAAFTHVQLIGHRELDVPVMRRRRQRAASVEAAA